MRALAMHSIIAVSMLYAIPAHAQDGKNAPEKIGLWKKRAPIGMDKFEDVEVWITLHRPAKANGTAVVICPGGGYGGLVTGAEGHGIAAWLNQHGITGVVLEYRLPKGRAQVPLFDAQRAIRTVRANAKAWNLDSARIGIMGFSAGGHLASTAGTHFDAGDASSPDPVERVSCRPDFMILVYPVVTMGGKGHSGSRANLLGKSPDAKLVGLYSNETQVRANTPPTFLAHAKDDKPVPPSNSQMFYDALRDKKVPARYLELPSGGHGLNGYKGPMWDAWQRQSLEWLVEMKLAPTATSSSRGGDDHLLHKFNRQELTDVYFSEGANVGDLNRDGKIDVVYGPYWFEGPDYKIKHELYPPVPQPREKYADNFFNWVYDFNGDGWPDVFVVGFPGRPAYVYENPKGKFGKHWPKHQVMDAVANESPQFLDLVGDERPELVCTFGGAFTVWPGTNRIAAVR